MQQLKIFELNSPQLQRTKTIRVFLPIDYEINPSKRYEVIYMHDGQNLFEPETSSFGNHWRIPETLNEVQQSNELEGKIVVGIDCSNGLMRLDEYSPWMNHEIGKHFNENRPAGGEAFEYLKFIVETVKPTIDLTYRTKPEKEHTTIAGSSMGGLVSLVAGFQYPHIFSKVGAFSPSIWFAKDDFYSFIKENFTKVYLRIYLDIGTDEGDTTQSKIKSVQDAIELNDLLLSNGQISEQLKFVIEQNAYHNEIAWARRFPDFLRWIG